MKSHTRHITTTAIVLSVLAAAAAIFVVSGAYDIGADNPHWSATHSVIDVLRERSIESRLDGIKVPDLEDPKRIELGAANYSGMCTGCHLSPGVDDTEIRPGLYPMPPNLSLQPAGDPRRTFWVIKHGIKLTAMPAWGKTHTDEQIWNMVAFLQKFPGMTPEQYEKLGGKPPAEDDDHMHAGMDEHMQMGADKPDSDHGDHGAGTAHAEAATATPSKMHMHADGTQERHPEAPHGEPGHKH